MEDNMRHLEAVANQDVEWLRKKDAEYGSSWKRRGGVGAFMMLARKWDRIESGLRPAPDDPSRADGARAGERLAPWDILEAIRVDGRSEGIIDDIRDLRRYLMLVETEAVERGYVTLPETPQKTMMRELLERPVHGGRPTTGILPHHDSEEGRRRADQRVRWAGEPNRPGTPEDGGHYALAEEDEEETVPSDRQPRRATLVEYQDVAQRVIRRGTMMGHPWSMLYEEARDGGHPYQMLAQYQEEYGK